MIKYLSLSGLCLFLIFFFIFYLLNGFWTTIKQQVLQDIDSALSIWLEISNLDSLPDDQHLILSEYMMLLLCNAFDLLSIKVCLYVKFYYFQFFYQLGKMIRLIILLLGSAFRVAWITTIKYTVSWLDYSNGRMFNWRNCWPFYGKAEERVTQCVLHQ